MAEIERGRRTPTEVDLTTTERQPDSTFPGRHLLRVGSKLLDFSLDTTDPDLVIWSVGLSATIIVDGIVLGIHPAIMTAVALTIVDIVVLAATGLFAHFALGGAARRRRAVMPSTRTRRGRTGAGGLLRGRGWYARSRRRKWRAWRR